MRVLVHVTQKTLLRHFESVLLSLADRGHMVRIASYRGTADPPSAALTGHPSIAFIGSPGRRGDAWAGPIHELRSLRDYLRYLDPRFAAATKLRARALRKMVSAVTHGAHMHLATWCPRCSARLVDDDVGQMLRAFRKKGVRHLSQLLALTEATIPSDGVIDAFLRDERPDLFLVTPLISIGSYQADFVKSAKAVGVPVVFPVFSWDNLTTKGLIHVQPDRVFVWNDRQRVEATELHAVPAEHVVVTGAPRFDEFFAMTPQSSRDAFCQAFGFDPRHPIVTYLCSSEFVAHDEVAFVTQWIGQLRRDARLAACNVLIRPHPRERKPWKAFATTDGTVAVSMPQTMNADQTLFDTVYHSAAVVGLNTSAQLEAGIVGRPVLTVLAPEFAGGQQGTLHFGYLLKEQGGFVDVAPNFETHCDQLAGALAGAYDAEGIRGFIEQFLRPRGLDRPATAIMVDALEQLVASGVPTSALPGSVHP